MKTSVITIYQHRHAADDDLIQVSALNDTDYVVIAPVELTPQQLIGAISIHLLNDGTEIKA